MAKTTRNTGQRTAKTAAPSRSKTALKRAQGEPDEQSQIEDFFASLIPAKVGVGTYSHVQQQRDFRAALLTGGATPEQCKRVLWQIFDQCGLYRSALVSGQPDVTGHRIGKQDIARWLLAILNSTPRERPRQAETDDPELG